MKSKHLLLLTLLLSQTAPVWGMDDDDASGPSSSSQSAPKKVSAADRVVKLDRLIQDATKTIRNNPDFTRNAPRVIVIGVTGRGKTTLLHLLAGKDLVSQQLPNSMKCILDVKPQDRLPGFKIGHGVNAGTGLPASWYDSKANTVYWDCPGFGDPAGSEQEVVNTFAIHQLFKSTQPTKIVFVASESDADMNSGRANTFLNFLERVSDVLPDVTHAKPPSQGVSLVITHQRYYQPHILLQEILKELNSSGTHAFKQGPVKNLVELLSHQSRSAALPEPSGPGQYSSDPKNKILGNLSATQPIISPKVNLVVSPDARLLVRNYGDKLNEKITQLINREGSKAVINFCNNQINKNTKTIVNLRTNLKNVETNLIGIKNGLLNLSTIQDDQLQAHLNALFPQNGVTYFPTASLKEMVETLSCLKSIESKVSYATNAWAHKFTTIIETIQQLVKEPEVEVNQNLLTLKGPIIGMSDVVQALKNHQQTAINRVNAFGLHTLFIDENITSQSTSLNLVAPQWTVLGKKTVRLSGLVGTRGANGVQPGEDGRPGGPGGNGGSFYGKGVSFYKINHLTVKIDGGPGGAGGNGVKGKDGSNGRDGNPALITSSKGNTHYYQDKGTNGQAGQNGGRAGQGGIGGYKGFSQIDGSTGWNTPAVDGATGPHGTPAAGGKGGIHGKHCQGTYVTGRTKREQYEKTPQITGRTHQVPYQVQRTIPGGTTTIEVPIQYPLWSYVVTAVISGPVGPTVMALDGRTETKIIPLPDKIITVTEYKTESLPDVPAKMAYRRVALPDEWQVPQGYKASRGAAHNGTVGVGFNTIGQQNPPAQSPLDKNNIISLYKAYYQQATTNPVVAKFVKGFPNL